MTRLRLLPILFFVSGVYGEIYQCTNENGKVIFKDDECQNGESLVKTVELSKFTNKSPGNKLHLHNIIKNPSFDKDLMEWTVPEYVWWEAMAGKSESGAAITQAVKPPDDQYIYETSIEQCVTLQGKGEYGLSTDIKLDGLPTQASAVRINLIWYKSLDCKNWGSFGTYLEPKHRRGWQHLSKKDLTPTMGSVAALIQLTQNGRYSSNGRAIWDNVQFFPLQKSNLSSPRANSQDLPNLMLRINLIQNSDFRSNAQEWDVSRWGEWSDDVGIGALKTTVESFDQGLGTHVASQCVGLGRQRSYSLGARFLKGSQSSQKGGGRLRLTWYSDEHCRGASSPIWRHSDPEDLAGWQSLTVEKLIAPAEARSARVELIQSVLGVGKFIGYWDDVVLIAVE